MDRLSGCCPATHSEATWEFTPYIRIAAFYRRRRASLSTSWPNRSDPSANGTSPHRRPASDVQATRFERERQPEPTRRAYIARVDLFTPTRRVITSRWACEIRPDPAPALTVVPRYFLHAAMRVRT